MRGSRKNIRTFILALALVLIPLLMYQDAIIDSLDVGYPFKVPLYKIILMNLAHIVILTFSYYLILLRIFLLLRPDESWKSKRHRVLNNNTIIIGFTLSFAAILLLNVTQYFGPHFMSSLASKLNLNVDWYFGHGPNYPHYLFIWQVIFWIILLPIKCYREDKLILFPKL